MNPIAAGLGKRLALRPRAAVLTAIVVAAALLAAGGAIYLAAHERQPPDFSLAQVRGGGAPVPRDFLPGLPAGALAQAGVAARKDIFVRTLLPLVLRANEAVQADRIRLLDLFERRDSGERLARKDRAWLSRLAERYDGDTDDLLALAERVDIIPPSLALTQAAVESGWGTSRFALDGNALFGLRTFGEAPGLVPDGGGEGAGFSVRRFAKLADSVSVYIHTLNTHAAYGSFREMRAESGASGAVDARSLLPTLGAYAEDSSYLKLLNDVLRDGRFWEFDEAVLGDQ